MSVNLHGTITHDNYAERCAQTARYKPYRIALSRHVVNVLDRLDVVYSLDGGNLLGAWRSGTMLPHDDDFDLVAYTADITSESSHDEKRAYLEILADRIEPLLDDRTRVRVVTSYCYKLEIYRPEYGVYPFSTTAYGGVRVHTDYHNVCCDLTLLLPLRKCPDLLQFEHSAHAHLKNQAKHFLPLSSIEYEDYTYNAPHSAEGYLRDMYGYLGPNAVYDKETGLYVENRSL